MCTNKNNKKAQNTNIKKLTNTQITMQPKQKRKEKTEKKT